MINSESDDRVKNNSARHQYRVLTEQEKQDMLAIKDMGLDFLEKIDSLGSSRELSLAKTKVQEAVFWAVNHITS